MSVDPYEAIYPSMSKAALPAKAPAVQTPSEHAKSATSPADATPTTADDATDYRDIRADKEWPDAIAADPEIGGVHQEAAIGAARELVQKYGTPEFIAELDSTGHGSHPGLVKFVARIAKALGTKAGQDDLRSIYPSMPNR